jgi:hypothetical protein
MEAYRIVEMALQAVGISTQNGSEWLASRPVGFIPGKNYSTYWKGDCLFTSTFYSEISCVIIIELGLQHFFHYLFYDALSVHRLYNVE